MTNERRLPYLWDQTTNLVKVDKTRNYEGVEREKESVLAYRTYPCMVNPQMQGGKVGSTSVVTRLFLRT